MTKMHTARNQRVQQHLLIVRPIARHYALRSGEDAEDLQQVGCLGLIRAAGLYVPDLGTPFEAFARPHIRGAILHYLRDSHGLVKLPRRLQDRAQRLIRAPHPAADQRPSAEDDIVVAVYRNRNRWTCLDGGDQEMVSPAQRDDRNDSWAPLEKAEMRQQLLLRLRALPEDERRSVHSVVMEGLSLRRSAKAQGVSAMTVQRRLRRGLQRLASTCGGLTHGSSIDWRGHPA